MRILIVDDDKNISNILSIALNEDNYHVDVLNDSIIASKTIEVKDYDLFILDIMMPKINGFDLCTHIRKHTDAPIIFITCLDDDQSLIKALTLGGDDYIKKPFNITEVIMRVKVHLRRVAIHKKIIRSEIHETKHFTFYHSKNLIIQEKKRIHLSPLESDLLNYFFNNVNTVLSYKDVYESIWNEPYMRDKSTIMARVSNLRAKVPNICIESVRGKGYQFII